MASVLFVELEACLDEPDRVCNGSGDNSSESCSSEVHPGGLDTVVEVIRYEAFTVSVGGEVYCPKGGEC